ncbi:Ubiquitin-like domain-containing protein [Durusdinium trenchii]|uniref:Ubiquitin-like domain-containing protein n=1 Tax=Durusdinium trenchii TaxID=1381693 RepID=A0ABP0HQJ7_9DINO
MDLIDVVDLEVSLLSGSSVRLQISSNSKVHELRQQAQEAFGVRLRRLFLGDRPLSVSHTLAEEKVQSGDRVAVTVSEPSLASTAYAFALVRADGSVVTWGDPDAGADSQDVQAELKDVAEVYGTCFAFAALLIDGRVITWGYPESGGDSSALNLTNVQRIVSSTSSFAALKADGSIITWGRRAEHLQLKGEVKEIEASGGAFAALMLDGTVISWGDPDFGGDSQVSSQLKNVISLAASDRAFAAVTANGQVFTWGHSDCGGCSDDVQEKLHSVLCVQASGGAFAALKSDGSVVTWGHPDCGGDSQAVQHLLKDVRQIQSAGDAFAAIVGEGRIVTWGDPDCGGAGPVGAAGAWRLEASAGAFCALLDDGGATCWGDPDCGGDCSEAEGTGEARRKGPGIDHLDFQVQHLLREVLQVRGNACAFAALLPTGVVTWGSPYSGGDSRRVRAELAGAWRRSSTSASAVERAPKRRMLEAKEIEKG